jgi:putative redox protein
MTEQPEPRYLVTVERTSAGTYVARNRRGGEVRFSTGDDGAFTPVELLLAAIAGCSSIDVDTLVTRRSEPTSFLTTVTGERDRDEAGASYATDINVSFDVQFGEGDGADKARALLPGAVRLSHDRLCTVSNTVRRGTPVEMKVAAPEATPTDT